MHGEAAHGSTAARGLADAPRAQIIDADAAAAIEPEWSDLAANAVEPNAFYAPQVLLPALSAFADEKPAVAVVRGACGRLIGLAPLAPLRGYSHLPVRYVATWMHKHCFFAAPLVRRGAEAAFFAALFDAVEDRGAFLRLRHLDASGPLYAAAAAAAAETGRLSAPSARYARAMLTAPWSTDDYLKESMRGKHRKDLRRRRARLEETGALAFERLDALTDLDAWAEEFLALEASGWKGAAGTALRQDAASARFFKAAVRRARAAGALQFFRLRHAGRTIAAAVNFSGGGVAYSFKIAYDEEFARYSPGVMIEIEIMRALEGDASVSTIDSCAKVEHPMIDRLWRERREICALNISRRDMASKALFRLLTMLERASEEARGKAEKPAAEDGDDDL
ncbi:MAG TPA: CelD-like protein [Parvularcula sp.]|nr:CelD-like protein [Parvularcula sp.]HBS33099.1 CelD-like protein [Parvularcula sp.]